MYPNKRKLTPIGYKNCIKSNCPKKNASQKTCVGNIIKVPIFMYTL